MIKHLPVRVATGVVACMVAAACVGPGTAIAGEGTTLLPAGAGYNAVARSSATFELPIATITCTESTSRGEVPPRPNNSYTAEENGGSVSLTFATPTFRTCTAPRASSVTVVSNSAQAWSAGAAAAREDDLFAVAIPKEGLRITIVNPQGTCTIVGPTETSVAAGEWTDGTSGGASTTTLATQLSISTSGTCASGCTTLEREDYITGEISYSVTNAVERGESITF